MNARNPRFELFDSLRAIAALSIFAFHVSFHTGGFDGPLAPWLSHLNVGVPVFFLVSGFLLYRPWARARWAGRPAPSLGGYALRRALRIVPAYWVALPIIALWLGLEHEVFSGSGILTYFGFAQVYRSSTVTGGIGQAWTLSVEVSFYLALPVLAWLVRRVPVRSPRGFLVSELGLCALMVVFAVVWQGVAIERLVASPGPVSPALLVLPASLDLFGFGMALAAVSVWVEGTGGRARWLTVIERAPWLPWLGTAIAFAALVRAPEWFGGGPVRQLLIRHELAGAVAAGLLLPAVFGADRGGAVRRILAWPPLLWVGTVSYAFYLWHLAVIGKFRDYGLVDALGVPVFVVVTLAVSLFLAAASWYGVERWALSLAHRRPPARDENDAATEPESGRLSRVPAGAEGGR